MIESVNEMLQNLFIGLIIAAVTSPVFIKLMYMTNQTIMYKKTKLGGGMDDDNSLFMKIVKADENNGTPNMGGIILWVLVPLISIILLDLTSTNKVLIFAFILFGFWGFLDVLVNNIFKQNEKFRYIQENFWVRLGRFLISVLLNIGVIYYLHSLNLVDNISLGFITIAFTPLVIPLLGFIGQFAVYSGEITDGLDGLMIGIFIIINVSLAILLGVQGQLQFLPILGIILGVQIIDLYFNIPPARFYNGGPGAMPLSITAFLIGLMSDNLIPYMIISALTWAIMLSSMIQILSMKFFKKRVFKIAPIHHHFQAIGWPDYKVTMRFWLYTIVLSLIGVYVGLI